MILLNKENLTTWPANAVYIGRGTVYGNPYSIGEHGDRGQVCDLYENRLRYCVAQHDPVMLTALLALKAESQLVCHCKPARCHGSSIIMAWEDLQRTGLPPRKDSFTYAGIGSRQTPPEILDRMTRTASRLLRYGYKLNSGGARGADTAFERGADGHANIFLPWPGFEKHSSPLNQPSRDAENIASVVHPAWHRLSFEIRKLLARNTHQVLGLDLKTRVDFVVCYTPDGAETHHERGPDTGGTGQAIALASIWGIPVFNFARSNAGDRLLAHLKRLRSA
jgi:hypothetical protein